MQTPLPTGRYPLLFWDVDTQVDFVSPDGKLYVTGADALRENLARLTEAARRHERPWVASFDDHLPTDPELSDTPDFEETYPPHCLRGTPGVAKIAETHRPEAMNLGHEPLSPEELRSRIDRMDPPCFLLPKTRFDVFTNPNAAPLVQALDPDLVVVYGVALDVCNRFAIEGLLAQGVGGVALVTDAAQAIDPKRGDELLEDWRERGVEMVTTDEILAALGGEAR